MEKTLAEAFWMACTTTVMYIW